MSDQFDDHTFQINTFNRPRYLFRLLTYIASDLPVGRVQIIDGSTEPHRSHNKRVVARFCDKMQIQHIQLEAGINAIQQFRVGIQRVETPYLTRCDDDNFITPSSVRHSIEFLRANADYAVCSGLVTYITKTDDRITAAMHDVEPLDQEDPLDRLAFFLANHWTADFATWRTEARQESCRALDLFYVDETMGEPLSIGVGALHGKFHVLPEFSVIFCNHDGHLGFDARKRQFGPGTPEFATNLTAVGDFLVDYCTRLGITPPPDPRRYYLESYLYYMSKWYFLLASIGDKIREPGAVGLGGARLELHDKAAEAAILRDLLGLPDDVINQFAAFRREHMDRHRVVNYEVFTVHDETALLRDIPEIEPIQRAEMALPSGRDMPQIFARVADVLCDPDWAGVLDRFYDSSAAAVLGEDAVNDHSIALFRGAFIRGLTNLIRPLNHMHPARPDYYGRLMNLGDKTNDAMRKFLSAITLYDVFCQPAMLDDDALEIAQAEAGGREFDVLLARPTPDARSRPIVVDPADVGHSNGIAFLPLRLNEILRAQYDAGHPAWLGVTVANVRGRMQFGLLAQGKTDRLVMRTAQDVAGEFFFQIRRSDYEYLFIRDLTPPPGQGGCELVGITLYTTGELQVLSLNDVAATDLQVCQEPDSDDSALRIAS